MTTEEWLVIAAAAVIFVLINIIMWSIIAKKEKRAKEAVIRMDESPIGKSRTIRAGQSQFHIPKETPSQRTRSFDIKENIVIVHTDERIN
ncbi:MAG: hypothetical protein K6B38_09905 [Ruminococcus sp.]|nr:hypothetical protein [Ruminococcus sp.]